MQNPGNMMQDLIDIKLFNCDFKCGLIRLLKWIEETGSHVSLYAVVTHNV